MVYWEGIFYVMKFLTWGVRKKIPSRCTIMWGIFLCYEIPCMVCEEFNSSPHGVWGIFLCYEIPYILGVEEFYSSHVFYLIKIMGIRFLNRRLGKNQIPNPREGKKFLILGKEKKNSSPSGFALGWGIFFLPLDEEFLTFPWVRNLILPQPPVEESLIPKIWNPENIT